MIPIQGTLADALRGVLYAVPWVVLPLVVVQRQRHARSLDDYDPSVPANEVAPRVSIVLPARNEAQHIAGCLRSILDTTWTNVEVIVVNDHSSDGTRELALDVAAGDARVQVVDAPALAAGWFGKQWACHTGAALATGSLLLFTDADTRHARGLLARLVRAQAERRADLISVAGTQLTRSFWEHAIQPAVFALLLARYGGTTQLEGARRSIDVIANGQCLMMTRAAYDKVGGHAAVRETVAEDLMLAQRTHAAGLRVSLVLGTTQLTTHMYNGFREIARGWMKNVYAGGRLAMWGGRLGRLIFPFGLVGAPFTMALPFIALLHVGVRALNGDGFPTTEFAWSSVSALSMLWYFARVNQATTRVGWRVIFVPLGALVFSGICLAAVVRGRSVEWKGRRYNAS